MTRLQRCGRDDSLSNQSECRPCPYLRHPELGELIMSITRLRQILPVVALIAGLMAMALSCGGAAEEATAPAWIAAADREVRRPAAQMPAAAAATAAPQAASEARVQKESAPAQQQAAAAQPAPAAASSDNQGMLLGYQDEGTDDGGASSLQAQSGRQLIVEAWVSLEVHEIDAMVRQVEAVATQRGGWIESADIVGEAGYRTANINVRVPAGRFDDAMQTLRGLGRVTDEGVSSTDVTDQLIDVEARLGAWRVQEERLIVLLENAATVEDVIDIERRISEVREDIERVAATQRNLENRVAASLIRVHLQLPGRFASDPPNGSLTLAVGNPAVTADSIAGRVETLNGYVGGQREYQEGRGQVVELTAYVRPTDLAGLMDFAATLGEPTDRRLNSVGPAPAGDVPNARLSLKIRSNVDSAASLSLRVSEPIAVAGEIRARAESLGGYAESWNESRWDNGEREHVQMELVVRASDLRDIMDFGTTLGDAENWEFHSVGQGPSDTAPNSRLTVSVYSGGDYEMAWLYIVIIVAGVAVLAAVAGVAVLVSRRRRSGSGTNAVADLDLQTE